MAGDIAVSVKDLKTFFYTNRRCNKAINGVSFDIKKGKTLGVVGESGCGKSVTASTIMQLLPRLSRIEEGSVTYYSDRGEIRIDQLDRDGAEMRRIRGSEIAMIFQDPMTALNPVYTIGYQIEECLKYHSDLDAEARKARVVGLLEDMGIPLPEKRAGEFPHQFSGGMRQRAMIAMAMSCNPKILIADEPTTALDVTIQAQIFTLMNKLKAEHDTAIMLITHDMGGDRRAGRRSGGDVHGQHRRGGNGRRRAAPAQASLYPRASRFDPGARARQETGHQVDPWRDARPL